MLLSAEVSGGDRLDCVKASDQCLKEQSCSTKYRTLRQCVAGKETNFSLTSGLEAKDECRSAMEALKQKSLYNCRCKRGMKKEKNCLRIYWSMYQSLQGTRPPSLRPLPPPGLADLILHSRLPSCRMRTFHRPPGTAAAGVCCLPSCIVGPGCWKTHKGEGHPETLLISPKPGQSREWEAIKGHPRNRNFSARRVGFTD